MTANTIKFTAYDHPNEGDETEVSLPASWCICSTCSGNGSSSLYLGAITQSDREAGGDWDDPDEFADYMDGKYDRPCDRCSGTGKVLEVDEDRADPALLEKYMDQLREEADYEAICEAERRMGA